MTHIFYVTSNGNNIQEAFESAVRSANAKLGTIADKDEFIVFEGSKSNDFEIIKQQAEKLMTSKNEALDDVYGPAGGIYIGNNEYLFFGTVFSFEEN